MSINCRQTITVCVQNRTLSSRDAAGFEAHLAPAPSKRAHTCT